MRGLDPGMMYSVIVNVFVNNQIVLEDLMITANVTVMNNLGKMIKPTVCVANSCNSGISDLLDMYEAKGPHPEG